MSLNPIQKKMAEANALNQMGNYEEAVSILKEVVAESDVLLDKMFAAGTIVSITIYNILGEEPEPNTAEYNEIHEYLKIALESYELADPVDKEAFEQGNNVEVLYSVLELMDKGKALD